LKLYNSITKTGTELQKIAQLHRSCSAATFDTKIVKELQNFQCCKSLAN